MAYDLAIVGSGAAAFAAAITAQRLGASVVMIERGTIGGTCVNTGCVPSKALLAAAEARHVALTGKRFPGLTGTSPAVDFAALIGGKDEIVHALRTEKYEGIAAELGWKIIRGSARFTPGPALEVALNEGGTMRIEAEHYLVATGSAPWAPPIPGLAQAGHLTSTTAMELDRLPASLIVIGGNAIGLEQSQLFARLGSRVSIVETLDRLAPFEEPEISQTIKQIFAEEGVAVHTAATATQVRSDADGWTSVLIHNRDGREVTLRAERLLVATGRRPITNGLGLERLGVKVGPLGEAVVDDQLRTDHPRIFAAGDVTGHPQFVYVAANHGSLAAENALRRAGRSVDYRFLPRVTFTSPAIASVGLTQAQAIAAGSLPDSRVLRLDQVPRAIVNRDPRGLVKLVADSASGRLLGIHALAEAAGEIAAAGVYVLAAEMTVDQLAGLWSPYLTMAEALRLAAQTFSRDVSQLSCCAA